MTHDDASQDVLLFVLLPVVRKVDFRLRTSGTSNCEVAGLDCIGTMAESRPLAHLKVPPLPGES